MKYYPKVAILIPAWNEQNTIERAIHSANNQSYPNKKIIVAVDNSTDSTYEIAFLMKSYIPNLIVFKTKNNKARKAGGLNQAIHQFCTDSDFVMVMDADTVAHPDVVSEGVRVLRDTKIGAICALTHVTQLPKNSTFEQQALWHLQKLEYASADSRRVERPDDLQILAGSCVIYRKLALETVLDFRGNGQFYDQSSLIEDYELTLTLKTIGWKVTVGTKMHSWTDVPISFKILWQQRIRWARSHVDTLRQKGWSKTTKRDILEHFAFVLLLTQQLTFLFLVIYLLLTGVTFVWNNFLWIILALFWIDRMYRLKYVDNITPTDIIIRALYIPEELYGLLHSFQRVWCYWLSFVNGPEEWLET
jgi:cellulose synthase/poly-beta-1,6-N-acetylglucosamine synthase-like glycosyltransferase